MNGDLNWPTDHIQPKFALAFYASSFSVDTCQVLTISLWHYLISRTTNPRKYPVEEAAEMKLSPRGFAIYEKGGWYGFPDPGRCYHLPGPGGRHHPPFPIFISAASPSMPTCSWLGVSTFPQCQRRIIQLSPQVILTFGQAIRERVG